MLILAPHVDDEILCGGTAVRAVADGATVLVAVCSFCEESIKEPFTPQDLNNENRKACAALGIERELKNWPVRRLDEHRQDIQEWFVSLRVKYRPTIVISPSSSDFHQDHCTVFANALRAFRNVPLLLGWESPNNERMRPLANAFIEITAAQLDAKVNAWLIYKSQHHRDHFNADLIRSLATVRGKQCRCNSGLAEAFELLSMGV